MLLMKSIAIALIRCPWYISIVAHISMLLVESSLLKIVVVCFLIFICKIKIMQSVIRDNSRKYTRYIFADQDPKQQITLHILFYRNTYCDSIEKCKNDSGHNSKFLQHFFHSQLNVLHLNMQKKML